MNFQSKFFKMGLLSVVIVLTSFSVGYAQDSQHSFKVVNKTDSRITKLLVAEPGKKTWRFFDVGRGIAPGASMKLVWNSSTDDESCVQWVKAVYMDKSQSEPVKFDFCEEDLELEFTE